MANTQNNSVALWRDSAERCHFATVDGVPHIGISGDEGDGFIVPVPAPDWFHAIADEGTRDNVFRAMLGHALRVGQAKVKAAKEPSRQIAADGVASALNGGYKPGRETDNNIIESEAMRGFSGFIRSRVLAANPGASDADVDGVVKAELEKDRGKAKLAEFREQVQKAMTYTPARKGKGKASTVAEISY